MAGSRSVRLAAVGALLALGASTLASVGPRSALAATVGTAPGDLDASFGGGDGIASFEVAPTRRATGLPVIAPGPDGGAVAGGTTQDGATAQTFVAKFTADGTADPTFGVDGHVELQDLSGVGAVAALPDGGVVAAGSSTVVRLTGTGELDGSFDDDGVRTVTGAASHLLVRPTGELVLAAGSSVRQLTAAGADDAGFGTGGAVDLGGAVSSIHLLDGGGLVATAGNRIVLLDVAGDLDSTFGPVETPGEVSIDGGELVGAVPSAGGFVALVDPAIQTSPPHLELRRFDASGEADTTWGTDGVIAVESKATLYGTPLTVAAPASDDDGNIVITFGLGNETDNRGELVRITAVGLPDGTFGAGDGHAWRVQLEGDDANALAVDAQGKPLFNGKQAESFFVERRLADGGVDREFDRDGRAAVGLAVAAEHRYDDVAAAGGSVVEASGTVGAVDVVRFLDDGTIDPGFNDGAPVRLPAAEAGLVAPTVAVDAQGRIYVLASFFWFWNSGPEAELIRLLPDGTVDETFGSAGRVRPDSPDLDDEHFDGFTLDNAGRPLVYGALVGVPENSEIENDGAVVRFTTAGTPDPTYGGDGYVKLSEPQGDGVLIWSAEVDHQGRLVVDSGLSVTRVLPSGDVDSTFGNDGWVRVNDACRNPYDIAVRSDGGVFVGVNEDACSGPPIGILALGPTGEIDTSYGVDGFTEFPLSGSGWVRSIAVDSSDRVVALRGAASKVTRLLPDGALDPTFGDAGTLDMAPFAFSGFFNGLAIGDGDSIVVAGRSDGSPAVAQLNGGGQLPAPDGSSRFGAPSGRGSIRLVDTRSKLGVPTSTARPAGSSTTVQIAGRAGVPSDATAVVLNLAAVSPKASGVVTAFPAGTTRSTVWNLSTVTGRTTSTQVIVPLGTGASAGRLSLYTSTTAHLVADVFGWFVPAEASTSGRYVPASAPVRVVNAKRAAGATTNASVVGLDGITAADVSAVVLAVSVHAPSGAGYVKAHRAGTTPPSTAALHTYAANRSVTNQVTVPISSTGQVSLEQSIAGTLTVDVLGWYTGSSERLSQDGLFVPTRRTRVLDTRSGARPAGGSQVPVQVGGAGTIAADAIASIGLVSTLSSSGTGSVRSFATGAPVPAIRQLSLPTPATTGRGLFTTGLASDGRLTLLPSVAAHLVYDAMGWYTSAP